MEYFSVGYVLKTHGLKGEIKVEALTDYIERFDELEFVFIETAGLYRSVRIESRRYYKSFVYLMLQGYGNTKSSETLKGKYLWITRDMTRKLPEHTYLIADIIGCLVITDNSRNLGKVERIIHTGSNDVYVIKGDLGEILIPALKKLFLEVDITNKKLLIKEDELEGLLPDEN